MQHIELHVIESERDVDLALQSGLIIPQQIDDLECTNCEEALGGYDLDDEFLGYVVALDDMDVSWAVCLECADPVIAGADHDSDEYLWIDPMELDDLDPID